MPSPFVAGQRGDVCGGGGQGPGVPGPGTGIEKPGNLPIGQADTRNRALFAQLIDVQQDRQHGSRPSPGVGAGVFGHHAQQRIAYGERGGETVGDVLRLAGRGQAALNGVGFDLRLHVGYRGADGVRDGVAPMDAQRRGGVEDQPRITGCAIPGHRIVGVIGGKQRINDVLRTARNLIGALIHEFGVGHGDVLAGQYAGERAGEAHLQILRVLGVIVHLHGFGQRPQADKRRAGLGGFDHRRRCRHARDRFTVQCNGHPCSFAFTNRL